MVSKRRSIDERLAELTARRKVIEARQATLVAAKKTADRKRDTRRKIIVGAAVLAHAEIDAGFASKLRDVLARAVQRDIDRRDIADLIGPSAAADE